MTTLNLDAIVQILKDKHGIEARVAQTGGYVAAIYAGPTRPYEGAGATSTDVRHAVIAGPGSYRYDPEPSTADINEFYIGPDDDGEATPIEARNFVSIDPERWEDQIATLIATHTRKLDVTVGLSQQAAKAALRTYADGDGVDLLVHTKECLANAMISAIQNIRDDADETDVQFRAAMETNYPLEIADEYLGWRGRYNEICRCHVIEFV